MNLETLDDVSFESHGEPVAVLQTKHSILSTSGLGDLSPDLWKTLRIWRVGRRSGELPSTASKFLIPTSTVSVGTAQWLGQPEHGDAGAAVGAAHRAAGCVEGVEIPHGQGPRPFPSRARPSESPANAGRRPGVRQMLPLEFMQRLAALVPRPRLHLTSTTSWRRTPNCGRWWCRPDRRGLCRARARVDRVRLRARPASAHRLGSVAQAGS